MLRNFCGFVQQNCGRKVVVEFKDESAAEGIIESCDDSMNITLTDVRYFKRRVRTGPPAQLQSFFARSCFVRFVHFQFENLDTVKNFVNKTAKVENKPRKRRVFESQTKLPDVFGHIKISKRKTWRRF